MARWQADARGRLQQAAIELYAERGFDKTTVAEIAQRAGLTTRTFFRHFADKREVLFSGEDDLYDLLALAVSGAVGATSPVDAIGTALKPPLKVYFESRPLEQVRTRHAVIAENEALQERELIKLSRLGAAISEALRGRGADESTATLTAELAVLVFKVAVDRWIADDRDRDLSRHVDETVAQLKAVTAPS